MSEPRPHRYSVIIPTLEEESWIVASVGRVRELGADVEIIVSDGGSCDKTVALAQSLGVTVVAGATGRGIQCNSGARMAGAEVLLFLHADTLLPVGAFEAIDSCFDDPRVNVATFRLEFDADHWLLKTYGALTRFDSILTSFGDQCIVIRREFFDQLGGFPESRLFEDVHLLRMARRRTRVATVPATVTSSARRFLRIGVLRCQCMNALLLMKYLMGVESSILATEREASLFPRLQSHYETKRLSKEQAVHE